MDKRTKRTTKADEWAEEPFAVSDRVEKVGGDYLFDGTIVAAFVKISGKRRYVVENQQGILHIFSGLQLRKKYE